MSCTKDEPAKSSEAKILTYSINGFSFTIDNDKKEINGTLPFSTDKAKLIAKFTISANATIKIGNKTQVSSTTVNDFSSPITYTITSEDGKNKVEYTVNVKIERNNEANVLAFIINNIIFKIDEATKKITGILPDGTDITKLIANFTLSNNATLKVNNKTQISGATANDFRTPITYTVISENGKIRKDYIVTVTIAKNNKAIITSFSIDGNDLKIDQKNKEINGNIYGLDITKLKPKFTVSAGATVRVAGRLQQSGVSVNDFSKNVVYEVTSQDTKVRNSYTIKITSLSKGAIISKFDILHKDNTSNLYADIKGTIDNKKSEITLNIDGTGSNYFVVTFVASKGAEVKANNMLQVSGKTSVDFTNTVNYSVKSKDGTNTKTYKVKINYRETFKYNLNKRFALGMPIDVMPDKVFDGVSGVVFTDVTVPKMPYVSLSSSNGRVTGTVSVKLCAHTYGILAKKSSRKLKCYFKVPLWNLVGSGTSADPYLIFTPKHLYDVRYFKKSHFKLMNDIDLSTSKYKDNFRPIGQNDGSYGKAFLGVLDGNGFKISNLKIKSNIKAVGLFRFIYPSSVIKNLGIDNANVESNTEGVGVIVGVSYGRIENCYVKNSKVAARIRAGGIAGVVMQNGKLKNSYVENVDINAYRNSGKLVGHVQDSKVEYCYSIGGVASANFSAGGLVGILWNGQIENSYSVNGKNYDHYGYAGGIIGHSSIRQGDNNKVVNCYSTDESYKKQDRSYVKADCC